MNSSNTYRTLLKISEGIYTDKGSKFIGYAFPLDHEDNFKEVLKKIKAQHTGARHFCYAYRVGKINLLERSNDDGEPPGTAGKPILNQLISSGVTQVGLIVVRYFGGTLLGTSGLIQAYKRAAREALYINTITEKEITKTVNLVISYAIYNDFMALIKKYKIDYELTHSSDNESHFRLDLPARLEKMILKDIDNL